MLFKKPFQRQNCVFARLKVEQGRGALNTKQTYIAVWLRQIFQGGWRTDTDSNKKQEKVSPLSAVHNGSIIKIESRKTRMGCPWETYEEALKTLNAPIF